MDNIEHQFLPNGTVLKKGTYSVEAAIASGGFGKTYLVSHKMLGIKRAMKEFFHDELNGRGADGKSVLTVSSRRTAHGNMIQSFLKEAQKIAGLNHRNIIKVHDYFEENGTAYYVMDLIDGCSLQQKLDSTNRPLPEKDVRNYLNQLLDALEHIHSKGILHLDLKPSNIMLGNDGTITLIDFGASKGFNADGSLSSDSKFSYTPGYAPIELKDGNKEKIGAWTDIYSLGATLYKMLTNKPVPEYSDIDDYFKEITSVYPFDFSGVGQDLKLIIQICMNPNRAKRPQTIADVRKLLHDPESVVDPPVVIKRPNNEDTYLAEKHDDTSSKNSINASKGYPSNDGSNPPIGKKKEKKITLKIIIPFIAISLLVAVVAAVATRSCNSKNVVSSSGSDSSRIDSSKLAEDEPIKEIIIPNSGGVSFKMIKVEGGTFTMGTNDTLGEYDTQDHSPHQVTLSSFYIGETEVTHELWEKIMGEYEYYGYDYVEQHPYRYYTPCDSIENYDIILKFLDKLNKRTGLKFRLPTEAEWEYAARGGNKSKGYKYSGSNNMDEVAWFNDSTTHNVAQKKPNELGIYDMSGNVGEWCSDYYQYNYYKESPKKNPQGPSQIDDDCHVFRGGSYLNDETTVFVRYAECFKDMEILDMGFRLVLSIETRNE